MNLETDLTEEVPMHTINEKFQVFFLKSLLCLFSMKAGDDLYLSTFFLHTFQKQRRKYVALLWPLS